MERFVPDACPIQAKFTATRAELAAALIERHDEIDVVLTALICHEHPLLVGPPGTAKSLLLDALMQWTSGRRFTALLTKFTCPEELFGPISVAGLKEDTMNFDQATFATFGLPKNLQALLTRDDYLLLADYDAYVDCQDRVDDAFSNRDVWTRTSILTVARMGRFSSDRAIREYAGDIWHVDPIPNELTST